MTREETKQAASRRCLLTLLEKLQIKSAQDPLIMNLENMSDFLRRTQMNFGVPDQIYMSDTNYKAFQKALSIPTSYASRADEEET